MTPEEMKARRLELELTQDELGKRCGLNGDTISKLERGDRIIGAMNARSFMRLAEALQVTPAELIRDNEGESKRFGPRA